MSKLVPEASRINDIDKVNLPRICREVLALLAPSALEKHIELEFEHHEKLPVFFGNSTAISILIRNLVDNAIRYCKESGAVLVRVYQEETYLVLEVQDNGPGIPNELRERVFERFFRVLGNKSTGSGLGLAIVRQVAELHGGKIELDSPTEGTGLIVRVLFPVLPKQRSL
jgi:two-component system sensor histidine kinase QseC